MKTPTPPSTEADLRALSEKATPGRWYDQERYTTPGRIWATTGVDDDGDQIAEGPICETRGPRYREDLAFIVACVNYVRSLLASQDHAPSAGAVQGTLDPESNLAHWLRERAEWLRSEYLSGGSYGSLRPREEECLWLADQLVRKRLPLTADLAALRAMLAASPPHPEADGCERCIACSETFKEGDRYLPDEGGGFVHFDCCGPERESFTRNGEPLQPGDPIPEPLIWVNTPPPEGER